MKLNEIKNQVDELIKKFGEDAEVSFNWYEDDCGCFEMNVDFDSADKEDDKVIVNVNYV